LKRDDYFSDFPDFDGNLPDRSDSSNPYDADETWMNHKLTIRVHPGLYAICKLPADSRIPDWVLGAKFLSITRTDEELSIVCEQAIMPKDVRAERQRRLLRIEGTLAFTLTGVLASVALPLATAGISIFATSTYDTDYLLVSDQDLVGTKKVLEEAGHTIRQIE
jgi:hypothetical protein